MPQSGNGNGVSRFQKIRQILDNLCTEYDFEAAVLVGPEGLPLAAARSEHDADALAAVTAFFRRSARQVQSQMGWSVLDEVSILAQRGVRLIGRSFTAGDQELILVVLLPQRMYYRQATNQAIRAIRRAWLGRT